MSYVGKTIKLVKMKDPDPIPEGTLGIVSSQDELCISGAKELHLTVKWEINRNLNIILPYDEIEVLQE